ncbi:MAG: polysaccharide biosynthesis tyrosine autokinase [Rikenellaceae bacterium]
MKEFLENNSPIEEESVDIKELIFYYLQYWYWFVLSVVICVSGAFLYIRYTTPVYQVVSSVVIDSGKDKSSGFDAQLESLGVTTSYTSNFDNEMLILGSRSLIQNVVEELNLYITYMRKGRIRDVELYGNSPIKVSISPEEASSPGGSATLIFTKLGNNKISVTTFINGEEQVKVFDKFPALLTTPTVSYTIDLGEDYLFKSWGLDETITVTVSHPASVASGYKGSLTLAPASKTTTVVSVSLATTDRQRGIDFVNTLVDMYNRETTEAKNEVSRKTSEFINDRILIIDRELNTTEQELQEYKQKAGIISVESDAGLAITENTEYKQRIADNETQLRLVRFLRDYIKNEENKYEILPANVGLIDSSLSSLIGTYNDFLLERKRLLKTSSLSNPAVRNMDGDLEELLSTINVTIASVEETLVQTQKELRSQSMSSTTRIYDAPTRERELIGIMRQQEIKSGLYLMLLQKREENEMTLATTASNARIFEQTIALGGPIAPKKKSIMLAALILGLGIPFGIILLIDFLKFKIETVKDVEKITSVPVIGTIPYLKRMPNENNSIVVMENKNDMMAEGFRYLRTNLLYMLKDDQKTILITSTHPNEGKSYTAVNLAISLALMGKKSVVVGCDIRKPGLDTILGTKSKNRVGLTSFLSGQTTDLMSLVEEVQPNFSILHGGVVPPNPTELLSRETTNEALNILKKNFDYVILDTAPVGMVTDTLQFSSHADVTLYVCRANVTSKSDFELINFMDKDKKLPNICNVIVGIDTSKSNYGYGGYRYGGYKYGGYKYGGYRYGGYGYGERKKKDSKS